MSGTPTFQITNAGLQAAAIATPTGPFIDIVAFQVGSAYGYTPQQTDLSIDGSLLFSGTPSSYQNVANATIDILCEIPPNAGPFQFGEIALMLPGNVLFAKAVFALPQNKFSALGTNVVSSYELHCLLTLAQGTAIFQISTLNGPPAILQIFDWSSIYPPSISAYPDVPLLQVVEPSEYGDATLLSNASGSKWTIDGTYARYDQTNDTPFFSIANASSTWIEVPAASLHPLDLTNVNERFVIETPDGYFRSVNSVVTSGANYRFNLNSKPLQTVPALGSNLLIYRDDQAQGSSYYSQILDPLYYDSAQLSQNTGSANVYAATYKQKNPVPYEGMIRSLDVGVAVNTGASTFACDGGTPYPIVGQADAPLQGGEISGAVTLRFTGSNNHWIIQNSAYGTLQIPNAQQTLQAVNLGQTNGLISTAIAPFPAEIATLQGEVNNLNSEVGTINGEIVGINNTIVDINGEIGTLNAEMLTKQPLGNYITGGTGGIYPSSLTTLEASGLLHPATGHPGMGRVFTNADNINDTTLPSGCYDTAVGAYGLPANWPTTWDGILQIVNYGSIIQTYYPEGMGGGDSQGNNGLPIYYRSYDNSVGAWSSWFPIFMGGKLGGIGSTWQNNIGVRSPGVTYTNTTGKTIFVSASGISGNQLQVTTTLFVNGLAISTSSIPGSATAGFGTSICQGAVPPGASYSVTLTGINSSMTNWSELR